MKSLDRLVIILFNISLIMVVIWFSAVKLIRSERFSLKHYANSEMIVEEFELDEQKMFHQLVIEYFLGSGEVFQLEIDGHELIMEHEMIHMEDVKQQLILFQVICVICFLIVIASVFYFIWRYKYIHRRLINWTLITYAGIIALAGVLMIISWIQSISPSAIETFGDYLFTNLHQIFFFFDQDKVNGSFLSASGYVVNFLNITYFFDFFMICIILVVVVCALWTIFAIILEKKYPKIKEWSKKYYYENISS